MTVTTILKETTLNFTYNEQVGAFVNKSNPSLFLPIPGEEYRISWDGEEWVCTAYTVESAPTSVFIGNTIALNGVNTGEPFFYGSLTDGTGADLYTFDTESTHTIAVYQEVAEPEEPEEEPEEEAGIILKDRNGSDVIYNGVNAIKLNKVGGGTQTFIKGETVENLPIEVDFSNGDQLVEAPPGTLVKSAIIQKPEDLIPENIPENMSIAGIDGSLKIPTGTEKTVNLDFSNGDMSITPNENELFSKVNIPTPETLVPENIAEGINIAGILGTLAVSSGGGGGAKMVYGTVTATATTMTVTHGLGETPKAIMVMRSGRATTSSSTLYLYWGVTNEIAQSLGQSGKNINLKVSGSNQIATVSDTGKSYGIDMAHTGAGAHSANDTTFIMGAASAALVSDSTYYWVAIA